MAKKAEVIIKRSEENPEPTEIMAEAIIKISQAFEKIRNGRLTERALVVLIHDSISPPVSKSTIRAVLDSIADLKNQYIKKAVPKK